MTIEELDFHFCLMALSPEDRKIYRRRLDASEFEIAELADAIEGIRNEINSRWKLQAKRIVAPAGQINLHLDYIESTSANALTFGRGATYFVGITDKMLVRFARSAEAFWKLNDLSDLLKIEWTTENRDFLFQVTFMIELQFISSHELGHLFHGHLDQRLFREEFTEIQDILNSFDRLPDQAREVEADGYAVHTMLDNLIAGESGPFIHRKLGSTLPMADCVLTMFLLSVAGSFFFLDVPDFDKSKVRKGTHPFDLARMNVVLRDLIGWCSLNRPELQSWASHRRFRHIMTCVQQAAANSTQSEIWNRQSEFLESTEGQPYLDELYAAQETLRSNMEPYQWKLINTYTAKDN
jgi:hypothetical protein